MIILGELITDAQYIRKFVYNHPKYNKDSIVSDVIIYIILGNNLRFNLSFNEDSTSWNFSNRTFWEFFL